MTDEEINRKFDAVANMIASLATAQERTAAQVAETNRLLALHAETQSQFIAITTRSIEALTAAQRHTDERLNVLIGVVERHITETHGGQA
jgi:hypothetical protein